MSELLEKLKKRRAEVDSGGLHFENETQESHCAARADASKYSVAVSPKDHSHAAGGQGNLKDVLDRRRATVDGAGESWESKPEGKIADFTSERRASQTLSGPRSSVRGQDFQAAIEHQRARVDEASETWQNDPSVHLADSTAEIAADEKIQEEDPSMHLVDSTGEMAADDEIEDEEKMIAAHTEHQQAFPAAEDGGEVPKQPWTRPVQEVLTKGSRITWLVALDPTHSTELYESPPFAVKGYQGVTLALRPVNVEGSRPGCELRLSGPEPRPANLQAMLFAGKGWKQKHLRPWGSGEDLVQQFDVPLSSRETILCGLVFRLLR